MFAFAKRAVAGLDNKLRIDINQLPPEGIARLPTKLWPFIWFFARQIKGLIAFILTMELLVAASSSVIFWYVGRLVERQHYTEALLLGGLALVVLRQQMIGTLHGIYGLLYTPFVGNMIRRQLYWYTAQQSLSFFNNDFAGRIANKLIQSAPSLRDVLKSTIGAVWFASIFTASNLYFMARISWWLALPLIVWLLLYASVLRYFVPKVQKRSTANSHVMSHLTGQVVDSFTNFLPIKYFARTLHEDSRMVGILRDHSRTFRETTSTIWLMSLVIDVLNTNPIGRDRDGRLLAHPHARAGRHRRDGDGAADGVAGDVSVRLDHVRNLWHFRKSRPGAGRHRGANQAARDCGRAECRPASYRGADRRGRVQESIVRLWARRLAGVAQFRSRRARRTEGRPRRQERRRQIDCREPHRACL
jgi:hypothetical protein